MKRKNNLYQNICSLENIIKEAKTIKIKNKSKKEKFNDYFSINVISIYNELNTKTYKVGKYNIFKIYEPKERVIMSLNIKDKIVNNLVSKYILNIFENTLIDETIASRKNKGSSYGIKLLKKYLNEIKDKEFYILKCDIKKYFYNINHTKLKEIIRKKIKDKDALNIIDEIIDSTNYINDYGYTKDKGISLGSLSSQTFSLIYLSELDHYIKEKLKIKYYIRYSDDMILIHESKEYLKYCLEKIEEILTEYKLELNNKTKIYTKKEGVTFLGFHFKIKNNKVIITLKNETKRKFKKRMKLLSKLYNENIITSDELKQTLASYKGHLSKGKCYKLYSKYRDLAVANASNTNNAHNINYNGNVNNNNTNNSNNGVRPDSLKHLGLSITIDNEKIKETS